jgi:hypothetical protein
MAPGIDLSQCLRKHQDLRQLIPEKENSRKKYLGAIYKEKLYPNTSCGLYFKSFTIVIYNHKVHFSLQRSL